MVTIKQIAKEANVSPMTVSNVVNGNLNRVSTATAKKIQELIDKYNYVPNSAARSLSIKSSRIIALCLADNFYAVNDGENHLQNPYNSDIIGIIQHLVEQKGYFLMLCGGESPQDILNNLKTWNVDGAIFLAGFDSIIPQLQSQLKVPMVFLDTTIKYDNISSVYINDFYGGYLAAKYLINRGHKKIAFASDISQPNPLLEQRYQGFLAAHSSKNIEFDVNHIFNNDISYEGGINVGKNLAMREEITAVFSTADVMAIGIMEGARLGGLSIPNDLSVIGFDDIPVSKFVTPKLTTIRQDLTEKGKKVTELLFQMLEEPLTKVHSYMLPIEIVERYSVIDNNDENS